MLTRQLGRGSLLTLAALLIVTGTSCSGSGIPEGQTPGWLPSGALRLAPTPDNDESLGPDSLTDVKVKPRAKRVRLEPGQVATFPRFTSQGRRAYQASSSRPDVVEILPSTSREVIAIRAIAPGTAMIRVFETLPNGKRGKRVSKVKIVVSSRQ